MRARQLGRSWHRLGFPTNWERAVDFCASEELADDGHRWHLPSLHEALALYEPEGRLFRGAADGTELWIWTNQAHDGQAIKVDIWSGQYHPAEQDIGLHVLCVRGPVQDRALLG